MIRSNTMHIATLPTAAPGKIGGPPSAEAWFAGGERVGYDPKARAIVRAQGAALNVFLRRGRDLAHAVSFLPGFPDGSFGWAKVLPHLPNAAEMPKLFVEYVGMGDSDKPEDYAYSTAERTDLVEAIWRDFGVQSTTLVAFDFSSLVVLEHLRRRLESSERREPVGGPEIRGVYIFNGGLFPGGHSHPWYTTPILRRLPNRARQRLARSATMAGSTSREQRASQPITKRKATGSTSAASSRLIALSFRSLLAAVTKIPLNIGRSTLRKKGWANSASRLCVCLAVTSPPTSSRKPWLHRSQSSSETFLQKGADYENLRLLTGCAVTWDRNPCRSA